MRQQFTIAARLIWMTVSGICSVTLMVALGGCGSATANVAAGLLGGGALAGAATHSSVEVKVEMYDPRSGTDGQDLELPQMLAIQRTILQTAAGRLLDIEAAADPHVSEIEAQTPILRKLAADDHIDSGPSVRKGGLQLSSLADRELSVHDAWGRFQTACARLAQSTTGAHVQAASQSLRGFRAALTQLAHSTVGDEAITEIKLLLLGDIYMAMVHDDASQMAYDAHVAQLASAGTDASRGVTSRLQDVFDAVGKEFSDGGAAVTAVISKDQRIFLDPFKAAGIVQDEAQLTIEITENAITTSVNLGPLSNEVTQNVLTPGTVLGRILDPANARNWLSFSPNSVCAGPGNNDIVFYMENQGTPILKSANFDPTKFIVAAGAVYERAFSILADASSGSTAASADTTAAAKTGKSAGDMGKTTGGTAGTTGTTPGGGASGSSNQAANAATATTADSNAVKALQKQIKAIKAAEVAALGNILKAQENIKVASNDATKLKDVVTKEKVVMVGDVQKIYKLSKP
jgi:hypothetical protein